MQVLKLMLMAKKLMRADLCRIYGSSSNRYGKDLGITNQRLY